METTRIIRVFSNKIDPDTGNNKLLWLQETTKESLPFIMEYDEDIFIQRPSYSETTKIVDYVKICGKDNIPNARNAF